MHHCPLCRLARRRLLQFFFVDPKPKKLNFSGRVRGGSVSNPTYDGAGILTLDNGGYGYAEVGGTGSYNRYLIPFETEPRLVHTTSRSAGRTSRTTVEGAYDQPLGGPDVEEINSVACDGQNNYGYLEVGGRRQTDVAI